MFKKGTSVPLYVDHNQIDDPLPFEIIDSQSMVFVYYLIMKNSGWVLLELILDHCGS